MNMSQPPSDKPWLVMVMLCIIGFVFFLSAVVSVITGWRIGEF